MILIRKHLAVFVVLLGLVALARPGASFAEGAVVNLGLIDSSVDLVQRESMLEPTTPLLMNGATTGLRSWLAEQGGRAASGPLRKTVPSFKRELQDAMNANPSLSGREMLYASLKGMLMPLHETYTRFMTPSEFKHLQARVEGNDESNLGLRIELDAANEKQVTVAEVFAATPAADFDVRPGDQITQIDGRSTSGLGLAQAKDLLCGAAGTSVRLSLLRGHDRVQRTLMRSDVNLPTVTWQKLSSHVGYIRVHAFSATVAPEIDTALGELEQKGATAYVLDLRDNRGGYVSSAVDLCSRFLPPGAPIMSFVQKHHAPVRYTAYPTRRARKPLVVLVNERTASASEIVAGALQDQEAATIMGVRSFGKALVQKVIPLADGSAFAISTGKYLTPRGRDLHLHGVTPDVAMTNAPFTAVAADAEIQQALALLESRLTSVAGKH